MCVAQCDCSTGIEGQPKRQASNLAVPQYEPSVRLGWATQSALCTMTMVPKALGKQSSRCTWHVHVRLSHSHLPAAPHLGGARVGQCIVGAEGGGATGHQLEVVCCRLKEEACIDCWSGGWERHAVPLRSNISRNASSGRSGARPHTEKVTPGGHAHGWWQRRIAILKSPTPPAHTHRCHQRSEGWGSWRGRSQRPECGQPTALPGLAE